MPCQRVLATQALVALVALLLLGCHTTAGSPRHHRHRRAGDDGGKAPALQSSLPWRVSCGATHPFVDGDGITWAPDAGLVAKGRAVTRKSYDRA